VTLPDAIITAPPQPGDFLCLPIGGPVGKLVEVGQFLAGQKLQPYEHAEIWVDEADAATPGGYTYSAYPDGQCRQPLGAPSPYFEYGSLWSSGLIDLTDAQRTGIVNWCKAHATVGYSALDYFELAAARLRLDLVLPPLRHAIEGSHQLICSQYVALAYLEGAGVNLFNGVWDGLVMPMQLASLLESKLPQS
jgi:hypothetical protein